MVMTSSALGYDTPPLPVQEEEVVAAQEALETIETISESDDGGHFSIEETEECADGSLILKLKMDYTTLVYLAKVGLARAIEDAVSKSVDEHGSY